VVDEPGDPTPEVYTFEARTPAEKDAAVDALEEKGEVVSVELDVPVSIVEDEPAPPTEPDPTTTSTVPPPPTSTTTTTTAQPAPTTTLPAPSAQDTSVGIQVSTNDPNYASQYGLPQSGFPGAWGAGFDGTGMVIAVVDTGVQANHPDLTGHVLSGYDFVCGKSGTSSDPHGHGTHVAGIAGARDNSIFGLGGAPDARVLPVRVLNASGSGSTSDVAAGINWAVDHGADVINLSLGGDHSSAMQNAVQNAEAAGVVVVAAAGNGNTSTKLYPAGYDGSVIAVGATTSTASNRASFSNYGSWVDIGAPGVAIWSTDKGSTFTNKSGTSMASPFVAAAAALVLERCGLGTLSADQVLSYLQDGADPVVSGGDPGLGGASHLAIDDALVNSCPP
jgi:thermitase